MKKYAVALFAGLMLLAIAVPLFAETYIDGMVFYRPRVYWNSNFLDKDPNTEDSRILPILYLGVGYKAEDYAEAYFKLYSLGENGRLGESSYGGTEPVNEGNRHDIVINQAWFDVKIPYTPIHWKVGRQAQSLGHGFYMNTGGYGGDGMKFYSPIGGAAGVELGYMKMGDKNDFSRDIDQYFLQGRFAFGAHSFAPAIQWFEGRNLNIETNYGSRDVTTGVSHIFTMWNPNIIFDSHIYTLGLAADGGWKVGGGSLTYRAEAVYAGGNLTDDFKKTESTIQDPLGDPGDTITVYQKEEDISGFALLAGATWNISPVFSLTFEGAYGSGDKKEKFTKANLGSGSKYEGFHVPMAQWGRSVWLDEFSFYGDTGKGKLGTNGDPFDFAGQIGNGRWSTDDNYYATGAWNQRGLENLFYLTVGAAFTPITPLTLGIDVFKFWAPETAPKGGFCPESRIVYKKAQDNDMGWEIDLTAKWTLNKNFSVTGAFAPWFPGSYFKVKKGSVFVDDPGDEGTWHEITKNSSPEWGYVLRANCVFTF